MIISDVWENNLWDRFLIKKVNSCDLYPGASLTAMHYVILKIYRDEDTYVFRDFWRSFKMNFRQSSWTLELPKEEEEHLIEK